MIKKDKETTDGWKKLKDRYGTLWAFLIVTSALEISLIVIFTITYLCISIIWATISLFVHFITYISLLMS